MLHLEETLTKRAAIPCSLRGKTCTMKFTKRENTYNADMITQVIISRMPIMNIGCRLWVVSIVCNTALMYAKSVPVLSTM